MLSLDNIVFENESLINLESILDSSLANRDDLIPQLNKLNDIVKILLKSKLLVKQVRDEGLFVVLEIDEDIDSDVVNALDCKLLVYQSRNCFSHVLLDIDHKGIENQ